MLNKPKQGKKLCLDHGQLMNMPIDYNDKVERKQTSPKLISRPYEPPAEVFLPNLDLGRQLNCRSVMKQMHLGQVRPNKAVPNTLCDLVKRVGKLRGRPIQ